MSERIGKHREDWSLRKREFKASAGKLATAKMLVATLRKNYAVDGVRATRHWFEEQTERTAMTIAAVFSNEKMTDFEVKATDPVEVFAEKSRMMKALVKLGQMCTDGAFVRGEGLYTNNYFSNTIDFKSLDQKVVKGELPSHACVVVADAEEEKIVDASGIEKSVIVAPWLEKFLERLDPIVSQYKNRIDTLTHKQQRTAAEEAHLVQYQQKIQSNACNPLAFDHDEHIAKAMEEMTATVIKSIHVDQQSKDSIALAHKMALETGKKVIYNVNHAGHSDSYIIAAFYNFLLTQGVIPGKDLPPEEQKKLRFLCGFYMAFTPGLRKFFKGLDVLLVPGINDMDFFTKKLGKEKITELFSYIQKGRIADPMGEIGIIFSGGGRGPYGGLKEEMPRGTSKYLMDPNTIVVDIHMTNTEKIYMSDANSFAAFNRWAPQDITFACSEPYVGGTKTRDQIFGTMVAQRNELQPDRRGAEKNHHLQKKIINISNKQKDLQSKIDKLPREEFLRSIDNHDFALKVEQDRALYALEMESLTVKLEALHAEYIKLLESGELGAEAAKIQLAV